MTMHQKEMFFQSLVELIRRMTDYGEGVLTTTDTVIIFNYEEKTIELSFNEPCYSKCILVNSEDLFQYICDNELKFLAYTDPKSCAVMFMQDFFSLSRLTFDCTTLNSF